MTGFTSHDDLITQISTNGRFYRADWQKSSFGTTAHTAGLWYSLFRGGGNPAADTILGTGTVVLFGVPGAFTPTCDTSHLPGFVANAEKLRTAGVTRIVCATANDHHIEFHRFAFHAVLA
jgi:hypothetical protein